MLWEIKTISCAFDFGIAIFVYFLAKELTGSRLKSVLCYAATVFGLTVFLNSSLWGQCDAIYVFFLIGALYFLLKKKQPLSFFFLGAIFYLLAITFVLKDLFSESNKEEKEYEKERLASETPAEPVTTEGQ